MSHALAAVRHDGRRPSVTRAQVDAIENISGN